MEHINVMKAIGIMYGIPLIALMIGTIGSYYLLKNIVGGEKLEIIAFFVGIIFTAISYLIIKLKDAKFKESKTYLPIISGIVIENKSVDDKKYSIKLDAFRGEVADEYGLDEYDK